MPTYSDEMIKLDKEFPLKKTDCVDYGCTSYRLF